ncbi:MAG: hypothetical protein QN160_10010 [Armatimonadota bacterium]|nr:hypothetical protein [Armatimonadota bacterium]MDR7574238.1 hypothetical protein [Armatimonadota bacterium]
MVIRIPRKAIYIILASVLVIGTLAGLYVLGRVYTPWDGQGRPMLLSPSVWAAEGYRRTVIDWLGRMERLDAGLEGLLAQADLSDPASLYRASDQAQRLAQDAVELIREATFTPPPMALIGLRDLAVAAVESYGKAAMACARWVGAPEEKNRQEAMEALGRAREARQELESSPWIAR